MTPPRRYLLDRSVVRFGTTVIGGSPLTLLRLTPAGASVVDDVAAGRSVESTILIDRLVENGIAHPIADASTPITVADVTSADVTSADASTPITVADVTIVVPTLGAPHRVPAGALVVDDGSDPPVPGARIRLGENRGPAAARNAGLAAVETPLVAFVDGDVEVADDWLEGLLPHFADPRVAAVAPRVSVSHGTGRVAAYERDHSPLDMGSEPASVRAGSRVSYVPAAALVCRVDALRQLGGFDTTLRLGEDVDLVWRLGDAGWRVRYEPAVVVHHEPRRDWRTWARQRIDYGSSAGPLARRHPRKLAPVRMSAWSLGAWLVAATGRPLTGAVIGLGSAAALAPKLLPAVPPRESFRLAGMGNLRAGTVLAQTIRRAWWPVVAIASLRSRSARRVLIASLLAAGDPRVAADDIAYSLGVWKGMFAARTVDPIVPEVTSWPGRNGRPARRAGASRGYGRRP